MSIRPTYRKRSVVQVLAEGMSAHPPKSETHINVTADAGSTPADFSEKLQKLSEQFKEQVQVRALRDAEGNVVEHVLAPRKFAAGGYVPSPEGGGKSCCERAQLLDNELARRNEELAEAESEIAEQRRLRDSEVEYWSGRAEKAEAERDEAWKEAEVWRKLWAKVANQFIAGTNEQQIERERDELQRKLATRTGEVAYWMDLFRERGKQIESLQEAAEGWPEWLGPKVDPDSITVRRNEYGTYSVGASYRSCTGAGDARKTARDQIRSAAQWEAIARFIESEQAATGDKEQRAKAFFLRMVGPGLVEGTWESLPAQYREWFTTTVPDDWTPPESEA